MEKTSSFILSFAFHCILFFIVLFWPASALVNLEQESYKVSLVMADMGGINLASSVLGAPAPNINDQVNPSLDSYTELEEEVAEIQAIPLIEEEPEDIPAPTELPENEPEIPQEALLPLPPQERLKELEEEAKALAEAEAKAKAEAEAKAKAEAEAKAKAEEEKRLAEEKAKKEAEQKALAKKKAEEKRLADAKAKKEAAAKAAAAKKEAEKKKASAASSLLAELGKQVGIGGGAGDGTGAGGGGIYDVYTGQVMLIVQQEWSFPIYSRDIYKAIIKVWLDIHGKIINTEVLTSSGRADFDASALNALARLGSLPAPPNKELQELELVFDSEQLF